MRISEIFHSVQGEGQFLGTPSVFVRTSGCNLRCWFCDTPYTSWEPEGEQRPWQDVVQTVLDYDCEHIVITGGEPLLQRDVVPFTQALAAAGRFITIETAGTVYRSVQAALMSISPKLTNSTPEKKSPGRWTARHNAIRHNPAVISRLTHEYAYQLKFVVDEPSDIDEIAAYLREFPDVTSDRVWLMPQAITQELLAEKVAWLQPAAEVRGYRFTTRLHIELFGNTRGT